MMRNPRTESTGMMKLACGLTFVVAVLTTASACSKRERTPEGPATSSSPAPASSALTRVTDRSLVCMVNNQFMGQPQIPIEVEGRTYYGCCEMCKGRLGSDPSSRVGTDPVSGNTVDKATAVIGKTDDGRTLYFENDQTFAAYARGASR
jgi:YHS domain-containing protein